MALKNESFFQRSGQTKTTIRNETVRAFQSVINYQKLRDSSLTNFPVFVVLYLEIVENINQMHKSNFSFHQLIATSLMT